MTLKVLIHDVGHGQAVHIFTPKRQTVVVDLGCSASMSPLSRLKKQTSTIDTLIITHPHGDHIDEFLQLKDDFYVKHFWRPNWLDKTEVYKQNQSSYTEKLDAYFQMSDSYNEPIKPTEDACNSDVSGVKIDVFYSSSCGESNINNHSMVVCLEYASSTIMIPGDNEPASWKKLLEQPSFVTALKKTDIFMASHHGRLSGYCNEIFKSKPMLCVVSDGRVQDTDAASRYSSHATGWKVHHRSGAKSGDRYRVTTRNDGDIEILAGHEPERPFLSVTVD